MLARGGFTNGASIAGEAGTEAVISFQRAVRRENLATWAKAGELLGVRPVELADIPAEGGIGGGGITFAAADHHSRERRPQRNRRGAGGGAGQI